MPYSAAYSQQVREGLQFAYSKKGVKTNPNILDLFWNRIPNISHMPMPLKETVAVEQSLKSGLKSHNFLTWSVVALIRSLHEKKLLPMDDPVISQLQKSF